MIWDLHTPAALVVGEFVKKTVIDDANSAPTIIEPFEYKDFVIDKRVKNKKVR